MHKHHDQICDDPNCGSQPQPSRIDAVDILTRVVHELSVYSEELGNGRTCHRCWEYGMGGPQPHKADCTGVRLYQDVLTLLATVK